MFQQRSLADMGVKPAKLVGAGCGSAYPLQGGWLPESCDKVLSPMCWQLWACTCLPADRNGCGVYLLVMNLVVLYFIAFGKQCLPPPSSPIAGETSAATTL